MTSGYSMRLGARLLALVAGEGCYGDPYESDYTRTAPKTSDVVGTYVLAQQTLNDQSVAALRPRAGKMLVPLTLQLRSDGTFVATNIPQWSGGGAYEWKVAGFKSGTGKWQFSAPVGTNGWGWGFDFSSKTIKLPNNNGMGGFLLGEKAPYRILLNLANDPDQDEAMIFKKQTP